MTDIASKRERLLDLVSSYGSCAVAFSAGVDSTVVAQAVYLTLGSQGVAVTGNSASLAEGELTQARQLAKHIGIRHVVLPTDELENDLYRRNGPDRCYHCKSELYKKMASLAKRMDLSVLVDGVNVDDLSDYRPGRQAGLERSVNSPLVECGITKQEVRLLAANWKLPVADKPAMACLASRLAHGEAVTPKRLALIDRAERFLRTLDLEQVRVRYHRGDLCRLEVPIDQIARFAAEPTREVVATELKRLGFRYIALDLEGFRSGSMNAFVPSNNLCRPS